VDDLVLTLAVDESQELMDHVAFLSVSDPDDFTSLRKEVEAISSPSTCRGGFHRHQALQQERAADHLGRGTGVCGSRTAISSDAGS